MIPINSYMDYVLDPGQIPFSLANVLLGDVLKLDSDVYPARLLASIEVTADYHVLD